MLVVVVETTLTPSRLNSGDGKLIGIVEERLCTVNVLSVCCEKRYTYKIPQKTKLKVKAYFGSSDQT